MKRHGNLWEDILAWDNLCFAARRAQRGKRFRANVLAFNYHREAELLKLRQELADQTYQPGAYHTFRINDPKPRLISAAPYRDRVVHHALCNVIVPLIERSFIDDTYANRLGYGTHRALRRFTKFARSRQYILQCDIYKYFPSIDHKILQEIVRQHLKCPQTLWLVDTIINHSNPQEPVTDYYPGDDLLTPLTRRKGLPIGNLTSQFLANVYLNRFDHWCIETLKAKCYLRYVDDFALFGDDRNFLAEAQATIAEQLTHLRLRLHPAKSQLFRTHQGANFVGFRVLPQQIRVRNDNLRRGRRRLRQMQRDYQRGHLNQAEVQRRLQSWQAHLNHGDTYRLQQRIFQKWSLVEDPNP